MTWQPCVQPDPDGMVPCNPNRPSELELRATKIALELARDCKTLNDLVAVLRTLDHGPTPEEHQSEFQFQWQSRYYGTHNTRKMTAKDGETTIEEMGRQARNAGEWFWFRHVRREAFLKFAGMRLDGVELPEI